MKFSKLVVISLAYIAVVGCGDKQDKKDAQVQPVLPIVEPTSTPTTMPTPDPEPVVATPEDSYIKCFQVDPLKALQNCSMTKTDVAPEQATFSKFTVTVDYPCRGSQVAMFLSTELGGQIVINEEPFSKTFIVYGKGPLKIEPVSSLELTVQMFQLGCYLKLTDITAVPTTLP